MPAPFRITVPDLTTYFPSFFLKQRDSQYWIVFERKCNSWSIKWNHRQINDNDVFFFLRMLKKSIWILDLWIIHILLLYTYYMFDTLYTISYVRALWREFRLKEEEKEKFVIFSKRVMALNVIQRVLFCARFRPIRPRNITVFGFAIRIQSYNYEKNEQNKE